MKTILLLLLALTCAGCVRPRCHDFEVPIQFVGGFVLLADGSTRRDPSVPPSVGTMRGTVCEAR